MRVVRGDDWQWDDQDGGDGFVGTVVEVGGHDGSRNPQKTVVVVWDTGVRAKYHAGYDGKEDLRVVDNAPSGSVSILQSFLRLHSVRRCIFLIFLPRCIYAGRSS